jgi:squalene-associated FAD-dependent desaturase
LWPDLFLKPIGGAAKAGYDFTFMKTGDKASPGPRKAIVIGAGVSGLAAAVALAKAGYAVTVHEAGPQPGGRCRTYFDAVLQARIDNGNHLLLSGNRHVMRYLDTIGARDTLQGPSEAAFPYIDLKDGQRWTLRPNAGRVPWWLFSKTRRVPGTTFADYLGLTRLAFANSRQTVTDILDPRTLLYRRLWESLAVSALNTKPEHGSARLFWAIVRETLAAGGRDCVPLVPKLGLSESLIDPAVAYIEAKGGTVLLQHRVAKLQFEDDVVSGLELASGLVPVDPATPVIIAVTAPVAAGLLPGLTVPEAHGAILNLHYAIDTEGIEPGFIGVIGGTAEWVFRKPGILSVTVSAADAIIDQPAESLAETVWRDIRRIYPVPEAMPPWRVVKEKRATFSASPAQAANRPGTRTQWRNLVLAGDWTDTGLPGTIEGSVRSGDAAAALFLKKA